MRIALATLVLLGLALSPLPSTRAAEPANEPIENFTLQDPQGGQHSLADYSDKSVVVAFLGVECPLAKLYGPRLADLAESFPGVAFLGINSNTQDSITELAAYARVHKLNFPLLKDPGNRVADLFGAERTPEVFVLDAARRVRYRGRIDDQYDVGQARDKPTINDLELALQALAAGKPVARPRTEAVGCHIGRVRQPDADSEVTYADQIARIMQKHCVECHRPGEIAPFTLTEYDDVAAWAETIAEVVSDQRMPPWHAKTEHAQFTNTRAMSDEEKQQIYDWADAGAPLGDPAQLPPPREFPDVGWRLGREPDAVIPMRERPFVVPSQGTVEYQYFVVDPKFTEDQWITGAEIVPGNRSVVHHAIVFYRAPEGTRQRGLGWVTAYVPGQSTLRLDEGMGRRIPAGSKLIFQMHYTPAGSPQQDITKLGLIMADASEIREEVVTMIAINRDFEIPPNASKHEVKAALRDLPPNGRLLMIAPHMHVRGRSFQVEAAGEGKPQVLLDVPRYDFNWQHTYRLAKPLPLEGLRLNCRATFDNSENNLVNPDPSITVRWGDQTWEEMMIAFFQVALPLEDARHLYDAKPLSDAQKKRAEEQAQRLIERFDEDQDGAIQKKEAPNAFVVFAFNRFDRDRDGRITKQEALKESLAAERRRSGNGP